jgi:rhodanese-related sulfurtransferase
MTMLKHVKPAALKQSIDRNEALLIDVREPVEYAREHILGAQSLPLSAFDVSRLPHDRRIVLCCQSGARSTRALSQLEAAGFHDVAHLDGGLGAWKSAGFTTSIDVTQPISIMRQVQITAGSLILLGTVLAWLVSPWFILLAGGIGAGLVFSGVTDTCMMSKALEILPYNQPKPAANSSQALQ